MEGAGGPTYRDIASHSGAHLGNSMGELDQLDEEPKIIIKGNRRGGSVGPQEDNVAEINCRVAHAFLNFPRKAWCVKDGCGVVCAVFTWLLIFFAVYVVNRVMILPVPTSFHTVFNGLLFNGWAALAFLSHVRAMITDPGAVPKGNATRENIAKMGLKRGTVLYKCAKCVSIKPDRAHHCSVCRRCIKKMDHHCPWVNNCVGENNQKFFVLFTMYIFLISFHSIYLTIMHFVFCNQSEWKECQSFSPPAQSVFLLILIFEGLLFGIFTAIMCGTQMQAVCEDETGIESLSHNDKDNEKSSKWLNIKGVFGHPFSIRWFSPFHEASNLGKYEAYQYLV